MRLKLRLIAAVLGLFAWAGLTNAQTGHSATISWTAPADATTASTYNAYRAVGACPATGLDALTFTKLNVTGPVTNPITTTTYVDSTVTVGNTYCYYVTQVQGGIESLPSNTAGGSVRPGTVTIQIVIQ